MKIFSGPLIEFFHQIKSRENILFGHNQFIFKRNEMNGKEYQCGEYRKKQRQQQQQHRESVARFQCYLATNNYDVVCLTYSRDDQITPNFQMQLQKEGKKTGAEFMFTHTDLVLSCVFDAMESRTIFEAIFENFIHTISGSALSRLHHFFHCIVFE